MIRSALAGWSYPSKPVEDFIPAGFAGARHTPILAELIDAIACIRARALAFFGVATSDWDLADDEFISAFNAVSAWITLRVGFACGIRAIKSPLPWARDIHPVLGIVKWADKDDHSGYHTRFLWVPEDVRIELGNYQDLLVNLVKRLGLAAKWRKVPGFFLDPEHRRPELIQPRSVVAHFGNVYPWLPNSHRRVARQWLRRCVAPSIAYVYMGHWSAEQEPWRQCAGRSLRSICADLKAHVPDLLIELGLDSLPWEGGCRGE